MSKNLSAKCLTLNIPSSMLSQIFLDTRHTLLLVKFQLLFCCIFEAFLNICCLWLLYAFLKHMIRWEEMRWRAVMWHDMKTIGENGRRKCIHMRKKLERRLWKENHKSVHSEAMLFNFRRVDKRIYEYFIYTYVHLNFKLIISLSQSHLY